MKQLLITIAALVLVGCGTIRQSTEAPDAKQEFKSSVSPDDSGTYTLTNSYTGDALTIELKTDGSFLIPPVGSSDKLIGSWKAENELLILEGATEKSSEAIKIKFNKTTGKVVFGSGKQGELQKEELDRFTVKKHEVNKGEELKTIHISIHKAAKDGDIETVKQHLAANTDVNEEHAEYGGNPLHTCATFGSKEIAELLIEKGANVNSKDQYGGNPLHTSAMFGQLEIAELLIEKGANVNAKTNEGETPLDFARQDFGDGPPTPKMVAVKKEIANLLRKHGGKTSNWLNADESIHSAASAGHIEAVKQHLAAGVDIDVKDKYGRTPLDSALGRGRKEIVELLIAEGADVNAKNVNGVTPLHRVPFTGQKEIAELLIAAGADVNAKNDNGWTPLHNAAGNNKEVVELLIAKGADLNAKVKGGDHKGATPLDVAIDFKNTKTADLLRKHGAKTAEELKAAGN